MNADYIIIGQGISGTWLSHYLLKNNKKIIVFNKENLQSASYVASGLINPVTGRRVVTTWMTEELMPFVWKEYNQVSTFLEKKIIQQKNMLVFPSAPDLQQAFYARMNECNSYIQQPTALRKETLHENFSFPFDVFEISPCYIVETHFFLDAYKQYLQHRKILSEELFDEDALVFKDDFVEYKNIVAKKIIYANGIQAANSKYWKNLPFVQNKGQALILELDGLDATYTYKFGHLTLISIKENMWWAGSSNELTFSSVQPEEEFKTKTTAHLKSILKIPFAVKDHWAALRPATVERRPFVGVHPLQKQIAVLNGMGSKGCSLAPWFAKELSEHLINQKPINPLADVKRFTNLLSKKLNK